MTLANPPAFFTALRDGILGPTLAPDEVSGVNAILAACQGWRSSWAAYALATAYHETAHTMQPIKEYGGPSYFFRMYDKDGDRPQVAARLGNTVPGDGVKYAGRGYVQLTGRANYAKAETKTGHLLVTQPDLAMREDVAAQILRFGMGEGWFTGKALDDYLIGDGDASSFSAARRIINGVDKAPLIAGYAMRFQAALKAGGWT